MLGTEGCGHSTGPSEPVVKECMLDFEAALWCALYDVFPRVILKGCVFHLTQVVWRKTQELGMQTSYAAKRTMYTMIRY